MNKKSIKSSLWPNLHFARVGRLDWPVVEYEAKPLQALGKELQASPLRPVDWAIGQLLIDLADTGTALKALDRLPKCAPQHTRGLNVATHYLALLRGKEKEAAALLSVAHAWDMKPLSVKHAFREFGDNAAIELDALIESYLSRPSRKRRHATKTGVLLDLDLDMRSRAKLSWFKSRPPRKR